MTPVIETSALTKHYGRRHALHGIDLAIEPGCVVGLIGPNGAGKTTTMRILLDIIRPSAGEVRVLGQNPRTGGAALRRRIGYLPGELSLTGRTTARSLLHHYSELNGGVSPRRIGELADRLGLDLPRPVRSLSKGNKQKVGLVQAFIHRPDLLVLDEPTSGLDPLVQQEFLAMVREARDNGQTVLLSSHVINEVQQAADEVAVLRGGRIVDMGSVERLRAAARRTVRVTVRTEAREALLARLSAVPELDGLTTVETNGQVSVSALLGDGVAPFITAVAGSEPIDLVVQEPDLESAVLSLYGTDTEGVMK